MPNHASHMSCTSFVWSPLACSLLVTLVSKGRICNTSAGRHRKSAKAQLLERRRQTNALVKLEQSRSLPAHALAQLQFTRPNVTASPCMAFALAVNRQTVSDGNALQR